MSAISVHVGLLKTIKRTDLIPDHFKNREDKYTVNIDDITNKLTKAELEALKAAAGKQYTKSRAGAEEDKWPQIAALYTALIGLCKLVQEDKKTGGAALLVSDLKTLETAIKSYVEQADHRWLFMRMKDGTLLPYLVHHVKYEQGRGYHYDEGRTSITKMVLAYEKADGETGTKTFTFYKDDFQYEYEVPDTGNDSDDDDDEESSKPKAKKRVKAKNGIPVKVLLGYKNLYLETKELYAEYMAQLEAYDSVRNTTGKVFMAKPESWALYATTSWYRDDTTKFDMWMKTGKEETPSQLITDENDDEKTSEDTSRYSYSSGTDKKDLQSNSEFWGRGFTKSIPVHPRVKVFDTSHQRHCVIHIDFIEEKVFNPKLADKLVLPADDLEYVDILMQSGNVKQEDIIKGKSGGMAILASGPPGTGKTLTAEIFSEKVGRPLYSVQCSELGVDPEKLEKNLKRVLRRAERWNAILQLDEADVYIRERGDDIHHNAIVGCILRVLEYFGGIIFMATNLGDNVDDAILSRCIAHLRYERLKGPLLEKAWKVLGDQFDVKLSAAELKKLMEWQKELSGRSIKNLLRNVKKYSLAVNKKADADMVIKVSKYSPALEAPVSKKQK